MLNIVASMKNRGISVNDIAKTLGCRVTTASMKLNGKTIITTEEAFKIRDTHFKDKAVDFLFSDYKEED
jgi:plasmid maintenance system antidote protein VapI